MGEVRKKGEQKKLAREEELTSVKSADGSADFFLCIQMGKKIHVGDLDK